MSFMHCACQLGITLIEDNSGKDQALPRCLISSNIAGLIATRYESCTGNIGTLAADADLSLAFGAWLGHRTGRQTIRSFNPGGRMEREPAGLACAFALRPAFPDEPRRFFSAVISADAGGDSRSTHLRMEDPVRESTLVVAASNNVSRYLGPYSHHFLADDP